MRHNITQAARPASCHTSAPIVIAHQDVRVLVATAAVQAVVAAVSGSVALLGDTLHNAADALTTVPLGIVHRGQAAAEPPVHLRVRARRTWPE